MAQENPPRDILQELEARKKRAAQRLETERAGYTYFALMGAELAADHCSIGDIGFLRVVDDSPNVFELAKVIVDKTILSAVHRYAPSITLELAVKNHPDDPNVTMAVAWAIAAVLRIRTTSDFLVPAASSHSWSTMAALSDDSCLVSLIEDVPKAKRIGGQRMIGQDDCDWVQKHFRNFTALHNEAGFQLAADSFSSHAHHANLRMATASLWAGIEALFAIDAELRFRVSALVATALELRGEARLALYRRMKGLYNVRSKAVHGGEATEEQLTLHISEVRSILSRLLIKAMESGKVSTHDELEKSLFSQP